MFKSIVENLKEFDQTVAELKQQLDPLIKTPIAEVLADATPLQKAKLHLVMVYALNSTVWAYLRLIGKDPKNLAVKQELDRVRDYMKRAKEVEDQLTAGEPTLRVNKEAAKRTLKHALWQAAHTKNKDKPAETNTSSQEKPPEKQSDDKSNTKLPDKVQKASPQKRKTYVTDQFLIDDDEVEPAKAPESNPSTKSTKRQRSSHLD